MPAGGAAIAAVAQLVGPRQGTVLVSFCLFCALTVCICAHVRLSVHYGTLDQQEGRSLSCGGVGHTFMLPSAHFPKGWPVWCRITAQQLCGPGGKGPRPRRQHHHFTGFSRILDPAGYIVFCVTPRHASTSTAWLVWFL